MLRELRKVQACPGPFRRCCGLFLALLQRLSFGHAVGMQGLERELCRMHSAALLMRPSYTDGDS